MDGNFAYSFILGVVAAVNPCGFAMLPAYLAYFVGVDQEDSPRSADRLVRALRVGVAVSSGFIVVFVIVGMLIRGLDVFDDLLKQARWAGLVVGILMVAAGVAMVFGWNPRVRTPTLAGGTRSDRSVRSMFVFGVAYAVASIGCTIGLFLSVILGSFTRDGILGGVLSTAAYGTGMGLLVTALTVAIALMRFSVSDRLRSFSRHFHAIAGVVVMLSGAYLALYWYGAIFHPTRSNSVTATVGAWQTRVSIWLQERGAGTLAVAFGGIIVGAGALVAVSQLRRRRKPAGPADAPPATGPSRPDSTAPTPGTSTMGEAAR